MGQDTSRPAQATAPGPQDVRETVGFCSYAPAGPAGRKCLLYFLSTVTLPSALTYPSHRCTNQADDKAGAGGPVANALVTRDQHLCDTFGSSLNRLPRGIAVHNIIRMPDSHSL